VPKLLRAQRLLEAQGGDCLFVYAAQDGQLIVRVLAAGNRRDVPRQMVWLPAVCAGRPIGRERAPFLFEKMSQMLPIDAPKLQPRHAKEPDRNERPGSSFRLVRQVAEDTRFELVRVAPNTLSKCSPGGSATLGGVLTCGEAWCWAMRGRPWTEVNATRTATSGQRVPAGQRAGDVLNTIASREPCDLLGAEVHFGADLAVFVTTTRFSGPSERLRCRTESWPDTWITSDCGAPGPPCRP
jgi:hypothetical protein